MNFLFYFLSTFVKTIWNFLKRKNQDLKKIEEKNQEKQQVQETKEFINQLKNINPEIEDELEKLEKFIESEHEKPLKILPKKVQEFLPNKNTILYQKYSSI